MEQMRDITYANLVRATKQKLDRNRQTGSAGGNESKLNEIDNAIIRIIGESSAVLNPVPVTPPKIIFHSKSVLSKSGAETKQSAEHEAEPSMDIRELSTDPEFSFLSTMSFTEAGDFKDDSEKKVNEPPPLTSSPQPKNRNLRGKKICDRQDIDEIAALRKRKLSLECELLELQIKKLKCEMTNVK